MEYEVCTDVSEKADAGYVVCGKFVEIHPCAKGLECRHDFLVAIFHSEDA